MATSFKLSHFPYSIDCMMLSEYHVYRLKDKSKNPKCDRHSKFILSLKDPTNRDYAAAVKYFSNAVGQLLANWHIPARGEFVVVPGHAAGSTSIGLSAVAKNVCAKDDRLTFREGSLRRVATIQKLANGGNRAVDVHMRSMAFAHEALSPPLKIIFDDVTTSGNSLIAAHRMIMAQTPQAQVIGLVLGRTADHD